MEVYTFGFSSYLCTRLGYRCNAEERHRNVSHTLGRVIFWLGVSTPSEDNPFKIQYICKQTLTSKSQFFPSRVGRTSRLSVRMVPTMPLSRTDCIKALPRCGGPLNLCTNVVSVSTWRRSRRSRCPLSLRCAPLAAIITSTLAYRGICSRMAIFSPVSLQDSRV